MPAWLAIEPAGAPAERPLAAHPLVGRDREVALIKSLWAGVVTERRPHLVTVLGPPGIGKSRLCHEVSALVTRDGGRILRGRCLPYGAQTGYQAFPQLVRGASGILQSDSADVAREKLRSVVDGLLPPAEARRHDPLSRAPARARSGRQRRRAAAALLRRAALRRVRGPRPADALRVRGHPLGAAQRARAPGVPREVHSRFPDHARRAGSA